MTMDKAERGHLRLVHSAPVEKEIPYTPKEMQEAFEYLNSSGFNCGGLEEAIKNRDHLYQQVRIPGVQAVNERVETTKKQILQVIQEAHVPFDIDEGPFYFWEQLYKEGNDPETTLETIAGNLLILAKRRMTREQLEDALAEQGTRIHDGDLTRLLIYELNKDCFVPRILGLTNERKPYNPLYVQTVASGPVNKDTRSILRHFNH